MTDSEEPPIEAAGVLSSLPGTRPQRRSPKRAATTPSGPTKPSGLEKPSRPKKPSAPISAQTVDAAPKKPPRQATTRTAPSRAKRQPPASGTSRGAPRPESPPPPQGFEPDPIDGSVDPPTGAEILSSVTQGAVELAELGLTLARRLAHSLLDRLPGL